MIRVADYIVYRLAEIGIEHAFLVTGGGAMHLNDAVGRSTMTPICFHHEQAAAMAAESYYRSSLKPCLLNVTTGPGGINAMNGVYGAYVDSCQMFVLSGQVKLETYSGYHGLPMRQLGDQEVRIVDMVEPITKFSVVVTDAKDIRRVMDQAIWAMQEGRGGPVWVDVPIDISSTQIDPNELDGWSHDKMLVPYQAFSQNLRYNIEVKHHKVNNSNTEYASLVRDLKTAKRPVLFAGNGVRFSGQYENWLKLAEQLGIPAVTGWNAHDLLPSDHPCYAGRPGTVGDRAGNFTVQNADLVIVLGSRLNIRQVSYNYKNFAKNAMIYHVDIDETELIKPSMISGTRVRISRNLKDFIPELLNVTSNWVPTLEHGSWLQWCRERVEKYPVVQPEYKHQATFLNPYKYIYNFSKLWNEDDIIVTGNGSACVIPFQCAQIKKNQRLYTNSGDASMGYDLPAAIGAAIANPDKRIICLAGDGSIMMNLQELQTIVTYNLNIKIVILNNQGYLSIKQTQENYFADNCFGTNADNGVGFPRFARVGEAFDIPSFTIRNVIDLTANHFMRLLEDKNPCLFDVFVDPDQVFAPKLAAKKLADGSMLAPSLENMSPFLSDEEMKENMIGDNDA